MGLWVSTYSSPQGPGVAPGWRHHTVPARPQEGWPGLREPTSIARLRKSGHMHSVTQAQVAGQLGTEHSQGDFQQTEGGCPETVRIGQAGFGEDGNHNVLSRERLKVSPINASVSGNRL